MARVTVDDGAARASAARRRGLLAGTVQLRAGRSGLGERFVPLFLVNLRRQRDGRGPLSAATNQIGAPASVPGGWLADRIGSKRAIQWFCRHGVCGLRADGDSRRSWPLATVGALLGCRGAPSRCRPRWCRDPRHPHPQHRVGVSLHSLVRRVPMAIGPLVAGALVAARGENARLRAAFVAALGLGVLTLVVQQLLIRPWTAPCGGGDGSRAGLSPDRRGAGDEPGATRAVRRRHAHPLLRADPLRRSVVP